MTARVLIVSPFAPLPDDAGHRRRVRQQLELLRQIDVHISFCLYDFEGFGTWTIDQSNLAAVGEMVDQLYYFPGSTIVGTPPGTGEHHALDEWWDPNFEVFLERILSRGRFDSVIVHNVWLSKALDLVSEPTRKILEIHDVFNVRQGFYRRFDLRPDFFIPSLKEESFGWGRAHDILSIQPLEREIVESNSKTRVLTVPYYPVWESAVNSTKRDYISDEFVVFGFLGSNHPFNAQGMRELAEELDKRVRRDHAPILVKVGGDVGRSLTACGWLEIAGKIDSESDFLNSVDIAIVPVAHGSGFKVKIVDHMVHSIPLICTKHAALGAQVPEEYVFDTISDIADKMVDISFTRPSLDEHLARQQHKFGIYTQQCTDANHKFFEIVENRRPRIVILLNEKNDISAYSSHICLLILGMRTSLDYEFIILSPHRELQNWTQFFLSNVKVISDLDYKIGQGPHDEAFLSFDRGHAARIRDIFAEAKIVDFDLSSSASPPGGADPIPFNLRTIDFAPMSWCPVIRQLTNLAVLDNQTDDRVIFICNSELREYFSAMPNLDGALIICPADIGQLLPQVLINWPRPTFVFGVVASRSDIPEVIFDLEFRGLVNFNARIGAVYYGDESSVDTLLMPEFTS